MGWNKRDSTLEEHLGVQVFHDLLKSLTFIVIGEAPLELRKGLIIWAPKKQRGVWKTFTVLHKMPRYLLIYYKISFE